MINITVGVKDDGLPQASNAVGGSAGFKADHAQVEILIRFVGIDLNGAEEVFLCLRQIPNLVVGQGQVVSWRIVVWIIGYCIEEGINRGAVLAALCQDGAIIGFGVGIVRSPNEVLYVKGHVVFEVKALGDSSITHSHSQTRHNDQK